VRVAGKRGTEEAAWDLLPGPLGIGARPVLPASLEKLDQEARDLAKRGDLDAAAERWHTAAAMFGADGRSLSIWFLWRTANAFVRGRKAQLADPFYREAVAAAQGHRDKAVEARLLLAWGRTLQERRAWTDAADRYEQALALFRDISPGGLTEGMILNDFCVMARQQGDLNRAAPAAAPEILAAVRRGLSLEPLPASLDEVEGLASLFPQNRIFVGAEATEEHVKEVALGARLLHFACHGLVDEKSPLDSALALTIPEHQEKGRDNGLLQAWEIVHDLHLDADLVTLSACDTALGQDMGSEGLAGLSRAFQIAGARSVVASMWSVADIATSKLMKRFYGYLRQGKSKDEALRAAQTDLIHSPWLAHPCHWAAFQLSGDWR
jgi:tetratricopeptide (TPR) repeat protein